MGGLVIREAARLVSSKCIGRVAFLNTPHSGSLLARFLPLRAMKEMVPGSAFLRRLDEAPWSFPTFVVWCPLDLVVVPGHSARWIKAQRIVRCDVPAHIWPVFSRRLHREIADFLFQ